MEIKKVVGQVSPEERDEILALFERKNGLAELAKIINAKDSDLYEKLVKDMGVNSTKFQRWWDDMSKKYNWESHPQGNWEINFQTCEVVLLVNE